MFQLSTTCKLPAKSLNLAERQRQVWEQMPQNVANWNALANVLISNQFVSYALDDTWNGTGRFASDDKCFKNSYDPSLGYMYDYWTPTATFPVDQSQNVQDSRMALYDQVDPLPRRLNTQNSIMNRHMMSWQRPRRF